MKKTNSDILILFFIFAFIIIFLIFAFTKSYNPSIDNLIIMIFSYLIGMIYLFFSDSKFYNFLEIFLFDLIFVFFTMRIGALSSTLNCLEKSLRLFYFLLIFSIALNFIKNIENSNIEFAQSNKSNTVMIQSFIFLIFLLVGYFTIYKIRLAIYTFIFAIIFFGFLLSTRRFMQYLKLK